MAAMPSLVYRFFLFTIAAFRLRIRAQSKFIFEKVLHAACSQACPMVNGTESGIQNEPSKQASRQAERARLSDSWWRDMRSQTKSGYDGRWQQSLPCCLAPGPWPSDTTAGGKRQREKRAREERRERKRENQRKGETDRTSRERTGS